MVNLARCGLLEAFPGLALLRRVPSIPSGCVIAASAAAKSRKARSILAAQILTRLFSDAWAMVRDWLVRHEVPAPDSLPTRPEIPTQRY